MTKSTKVYIAFASFIAVVIVLTLNGRLDGTKILLAIAAGLLLVAFVVNAIFEYDDLGERR